MMENLDRVIERDSKIQVSRQRASSLVEESRTYGSRARQVRNTMRRRKYCYIAAGIITAIVSSLTFVIQLKTDMLCVDRSPF